MMRLWQTAGLAAAITTMTCPLNADEPGKSFSWEPLKVEASRFSQDLGMLDAEREEYAGNLAACAVNAVAQAKATPHSLENARRMLALALHLSPRNKRALVANFQLAKGLIPNTAEGNHSPQVFARLMLTRGQLLDQQGGTENRNLARLLIQLAAELDPKNEDAVYASEVQRLDHGTPDWTEWMKTPEKPPLAP